MRDRNFEQFFEVLSSIFASIGYDLHIPEEKYYQTVFFLIFTLLGLKISAEVKTNIGRIDVVIEDKDILIFEFKFDDTAVNALTQIHKNKYYEKYIGSNPRKEMYLFGVSFKNKNISEWLSEKV
jgi:hypothetical protein